jgi:hypothetical protein
MTKNRVDAYLAQRAAETCSAWATGLSDGVIGLQAGTLFGREPGGSRPPAPSSPSLQFGHLVAIAGASVVLGAFGGGIAWQFKHTGLAGILLAVGVAGFFTAAFYAAVGVGEPPNESRQRPSL